MGLVVIEEVLRRVLIYMLDWLSVCLELIIIHICYMYSSKMIKLCIFSFHEYSHSNEIIAAPLALASIVTIETAEFVERFIITFIIVGIIALSLKISIIMICNILIITKKIIQPRALADYARSALLKTESGAVQCGARGLEVIISIIW